MYASLHSRGGYIKSATVVTVSGTVHQVWITLHEDLHFFVDTCFRGGGGGGGCLLVAEEI